MTDDLPPLDFDLSPEDRAHDLAPQRAAQAPRQEAPR
jgi:hypothetical protein